jgi:lysophospholipase L1-like esterase
MINIKYKLYIIKSKYIFYSIFLFIFGYFWGGLTFYKQLYPFEQIRTLKYTFFNQTNKSKPRNTLFNTFSPNSCVVMIGDSITEGGIWNEIFSDVKVANRGIGGDRTDDILNRLDSIFAVNAKKAFLMVGINDIYSGNSIDKIFTNYINIVQQLLNKGTDVYIQSTLECSANKCGYKLKKVRALNAKLKAYSEEKNIPYIDINIGLTNEHNGLLKEYTQDGIHLLGNGYLKWSQMISPYIK